MEKLRLMSRDHSLVMYEANQLGKVQCYRKIWSAFGVKRVILLLLA